MRYIIAALVAIGVIVLVFVLFLSGGSSKVKPPLNLSSTVNSVQLTIDGPETADQTHDDVVINVNQNLALINIEQGYQGKVVNSASYVNNQTAYTVFLHALMLANFTKTRSTSQTDERGVCPLGDRYIFEVMDGSGTDVQRTWATSCGGQGTFGGSTALVMNLFESQIPDYEKLSSNLNIAPQPVTLL